MLRKVRGLAGLCLLCTNLSQSIAINCAPNRPLIQRDQVTHGECNGVLDLHEFEDALKEAGLDVGHYPQFAEHLGRLELDQPRSVLGFLLDIEDAGGMRHAQRWRAICISCRPPRT